MARILRQSTSVDVPIGAFVDQTDGFSPETTLTITQPDIRLKKNGGAWAQKNAAQTLSHEENGNYEVTLDATDTNTLGLLRLHVNESGALPVTEDFEVVTQNYWDSLFSTDFLQVDLTQIGGVAQSATDLKDFADDGYDPSTNKVQGVVLTDTVTTLTGNTPQTGDSFARIGATGSGLTSLASQTSVTTIDDLLDTEIADIQARLPAALVSGRIKAIVEAFAANIIDDAAIAADVDQYAAKVWVIKEGTTADHYAVAFYKNGQRVTSGVTDPEIQVIKGSDGTDLIAETSLSEIGSTHRFKKDESTNQMEAGAVYFAVVSATIDGSLRSWDQQIGRDSA